MNVYSDPAFVAAEMAYRYERDHITTAVRPPSDRSRLAGVWHRLTHRTTVSQA